MVVLLPVSTAPEQYLVFSRCQCLFNEPMDEQVTASLGYSGQDGEQGPRFQKDQMFHTL